MRILRKLLPIVLIGVVLCSTILYHVPVYADSVDLYWYPVAGSGTGNWNGGGHWATAPDGTGLGHADPTSTNNVFFTSTSFTGAGQVVTINSNANCKDMTWTGATNTPTLSGSASTYIFGSVTFISAMVRSYSGAFGLDPTSGNFTFTFGGTWPSVTIFNFYASGGASTAKYTFQDDLNIGNGAFYQDTGIIDTNGKTITCGAFNLRLAQTRTLTLGSSVINCTSWNYTGSNLTVTANTSTINCSGNFSGGGITTYNIVNLTGATPTISGTNTFAQLNLASGTTQTVTFTDGTNQTVTTASLSGSAGHVHTLQGTSTSGWTITKAGGGTIVSDYVAVSYSTANPDSTFYAFPNSTDNGHNTRWYFSLLPPTNFTSTISDNTVILTWGLGSGADTTVIMKSNNSYPKSITDGVQVYSGSGTTYTDTSLSEISTNYYSAFSYNTTASTYSSTYSTTQNGGTAMILIGLIILAGVLTFIELRFRAYALGIVNAGLWVGIAFYIKANPLPNIPAGSSLDTIIYVCLIGAGILIGLFSAGNLFSKGNGLSFREKAFGGASDAQRVYNYNGDSRKQSYDTSTMAGRQAAYRAQIHSKLNQSKKR